ncbi:dual specificity mitogen-activated protein kinase kinase 5 [Elysia marginata]|uniref:mitogen-activated protein kinase kinase n=1 Tax=Elysia marginata TaxID=1093978 RepID=A0AAV4IMZ5_9GAST|nr:dual specificity mitogen-activated protein kinase kinase 5 [Elysia marginata]
MEESKHPPFTIRIRTENNQDMDWMVKPDEVTFLRTLEVFTQIMPQSTHTAFEYEDEDGDRITVRSDEEMRDMFNYYFGELSAEDKARGLLPPLIIFPKQGKTPQTRNIHGLKIQTNGQKPESPQQQQKVTGPAMPQQVGLESILSCGQISKESLHYVQLLGHGNSGRVYRAVHKQSNQVMAVKVNIKPYNILVNSAGEVKLCDFGVSTQLVQSIASTYLGTNVYLSPERVQGQEYGKPAEVWSFGVTLFELATGKLPFKSLNQSTKTTLLQPFEIMRVIIDEPQLILPTEHFSPELIDFVNKW